jgi:polyisoprenoid-binding protein YceI
MNTPNATNAPADTTAAPAPRRHRRRRWAVAGLAIVAVLVVGTVGAVAVYVGQSGDPPLALPSGVPAAPVGPIEGEWTVAAGSQAGFRVGQTVLGMQGDVTGRTSGVTGSLTVAGDQIAAAEFQVDLTSIEANGKSSPQFEQSLDTTHYPTATITLSRPLSLGSGFDSGTIVTATVNAELALRGTTHEVTFTVQGRRDGPAIEAAGSIPIDFSEWGITLPAGFGPLGSLADHGEAEFLLVLNRR